MYLESEVFPLLVIGLAFGHLIFALVGGYFLIIKAKRKLNSFWGYIVCSIISFCCLLNALFGDRLDPGKLFASTDSISMGFFGIFWLGGICCLITLISALCKEKR